MGPVSANRAPLVGSFSIGQYRMAGDKFENLDTHHFAREEDGTQWVWSFRTPEGDIKDRAKADGLSRCWSTFLK